MYTKDEVLEERISHGKEIIERGLPPKAGSREPRPAPPYIHRQVRTAQRELEARQRRREAEVKDRKRLEGTDVFNDPVSVAVREAIEALRTDELALVEVREAALEQRGSLAVAREEFAQSEAEHATAEISDQEFLSRQREFVSTQERLERLESDILKLTAQVRIRKSQLRDAKARGVERAAEMQHERDVRIAELEKTLLAELEKAAAEQDDISQSMPSVNFVRIVGPHRSTVKRRLTLKTEES